MGRVMATKRLLIYSHDSFGLGHLRRSRSIALSLARRDPSLEVLILSGLPIIAEFEMHRQVDFALVPGIIKLASGDYRAVAEGVDLDHVIGERSAIIRETARDWRPDLFLVDKEPLGIRGEVRATLEDLRARGVPVVLGLRDVMDEPARLAVEWDRKHASQAIAELYDELWVYGLPEIYEPLAGIALDAATEAKMIYTGYLRRATRTAGHHPPPIDLEPPFLLVTPGGGGDGHAMVDWVIRAVEQRPDAAERLVVVVGPFMEQEQRNALKAAARHLPRIEMLTFVAGMEPLIEAASGIVAMGGYNTFCEILSFDKPALVVPRAHPRLEQLLRAERAAELGLISMLADDGTREPRAMAGALEALRRQPKPSSRVIPGLLDGHDRIAERVSAWLDRPSCRTNGQHPPRGDATPADRNDLAEMAPLSDHVAP